MTSTFSDFVELTRSDISHLPPVLFGRLPKAAQLYNIVQLCLQYKYNDHNFFRYTELDLSLTMLAARIVTKTKTYWYILAPIVPSDALGNIVTSFVKLVDWNTKISFNAVDNTIYQILTNTCGVPEGYTKSIYNSGLYTMAMETALGMNLSLPQGLTISPLKEGDMKTVFEHWVHAGELEPAEQQFVARSSLQIGSAGLYLDNKLVTFGMNWPDGGIHVVHTLDEYRGRGYAQTLMRHLCYNTAATLKEIPVVHIVENNHQSEKLMKGLGFTFSHAITWTEYDK